MLRKKLSGLAVVAAAACVVALSLVSNALAQVDDGDGFDGDELLSLPVLLAVVVLGALVWSVFRGGSRRSQK